MEEPKKEEKSEKELRVRKITKLYYSNPKIQEIILNFSQNREVVPRYFEGFGKRPDTIQYPSDIMGLVNKGATSFHGSEEIWNDPLQLSTDLSPDEVNKLRKSWDLLIDIDSPYLDLSNIAARLIVKALENHGIKNYGIKFSVAGETPVLIKINGRTKLVTINEAINLFKSGKKVKIFSLDKNKKVKFADIYNSLEHEDTLYEVKHEQSKVPLKTTAHHSVFVFDRGKIIQKRVADINIGDYLVTFNSPVRKIDKDIDYVDHSFMFNNIKKNKSVKINSSLMRLIGYYLAEGHITNIIHQIGFTFNINEKEYIQDCTRLLKQLTGKNVSIRHPNTGSTQLIIHSKEWSSFFELICGKSRQKHVPYFVWDIKKELFMEMLKGYIRGDGYKVGKYGIVIKSVALQLIRELVWLCKLNGISCSLSHEKNKPHRLPQGNMFKGSFVYILKIPKSELLIDEFYRERDKLSPYPRDRTFPIDGLKEVYKKIKPKMFNRHRTEQMTLSKKRANLGRIKKVIDWFNSFKSHDFDEESNKIIKNYKSLFNSDIGVVEVKDIIKTKKEMVYDVSVKETEAFFGNDYPILLHNSGSKGFHIIVSGNAFPEEYEGMKMKESFPEWPRAITEYLFSYIRREYNLEAGKMMSFSNLEDKEKPEEKIWDCLNCGRQAKQGNLVNFHCPICDFTMERRDSKISKRRLRCLNPGCAGELEVQDQKPYFFCEFCKNPNSELQLSSDKNPESFEEMRGEDAGKYGKLDLVLVAPRHLFRMPYSLHEKTSLASAVLSKEQLNNFSPKDASPFSIKIVEFMPKNEKDEAKTLLREALRWKKTQMSKEEEEGKKITKEYKPLDNSQFKDVPEEFFPLPIKKLLKGLQDGKKRGLFILITFLRALNFTPEYINNKVRDWNKLNSPPLKEGYVRSQVEWHLRQRKLILPPNYDNESFYKDLNLLDKKPETKNPIVDVSRRMWKGK